MCRLRIGTLDAPTEFHGQTWKLIGKFDFLCQVLSSGYKVHCGVPRRAQKEGNIYLGAEGTDKRERVCRGWGTACIKPWRDRQNTCVWRNKRLGWRSRAQGTVSEDEVEVSQGCSLKALHLGKGVDLTLKARGNWEIKRGQQWSDLWYVPCSTCRVGSWACVSWLCAYLFTVLGWALRVARSPALKTSCLAEVKCFQWSSKLRSKEAPLGQALF